MKRRTAWSGSRWLAAVLAVALLTPLAPAGDTVRTALPADGMSAAALNAEFTGYADTMGGWSGGDSTASVALPDGRLVWLFSDTFLGTVNSDHSRPRSSPFVNNSLMIQDGTELIATRHGGTVERPDALVKPPDADEQYFVADGTVEGNMLRVLYNRYHKTGIGGLDVELRGTALVTYSLPDLMVQTVTELPLGQTTAWGSAIVVGGEYTYIYGTEFATHGMRFAHLARVPAGGLGGAWQFWTGADWSGTESRSARLFSGVGTAFGVQKVGGRYVVVTQELNLLLAPTFVGYTAEAPTGPFAGPIPLFTAPEPEPGKSIIAYDSRFHEELARPGKLLVSYNVNSLVADDNYADARIYRPRFVEVDWPRPVPDPGALPAAPSGLTASADAAGDVQLSWAAPPGTGLRYWLYQRDVTAGQTHFARIPSPVTDTRATAGMLSSDHTYEFRVAADRGAGVGPASAPASAVPRIEPPPAPTGLAATADNAGQVTLSWSQAPRARNYDVLKRDVTAGETEFVRITSTVEPTLLVQWLEIGHEYEFHVVANGGGGSSAPSDPVRTTVRHAAPAAPTGLTATAQPDGTVKLDWSAPGPEVWYLVYFRDITAEETDFTRIRLPITTGTTFTASHLTHDHAYEFKVAATNRGGEGAASATARATARHPLPAGPAGLTAAAQPDGTVKLDWSAPGPGVWHLVYFRDVTAEETDFTQVPLPITGTTFTAGHLTHDHEYEFKVVATNQAGEGPASNLARATARYPLPGTPTNLRAVAGDGQAQLTWDGPDTDVWYLVYLRNVTEAEPEFTALPLPVTDGTRMTVGHLTNGHTYEFKVVATNQAGEGAASNVVRVTPAPPVPGRPTGPTATPQPDGTIKLSWTAPGPDVWYWVYHRDAAGGDWKRWQHPVTEGTTATAGSLTHGHTYQFKVTAFNSTGEGPASDVVEARSHYAPPPAPTNLRGVAAGDGSIDLDWDAPAASLHYWVWYRDRTAGEAFQRSAAPTDKISATWGDLRHGHEYEFYVTGQNQGGVGPASNTIRVTSYGGLPAAPSRLTATAGDGQATLRWTVSPTPNVLHVVYQRNVSRGESWRALPTAVNGTTLTVGNLANGDTYEFKVAAANASGNSRPSNVASVRPLPPRPQPASNLLAFPGDGEVLLGWSASPTLGTWYWVEYRPRGGSWQRLKYPLPGQTRFTVGYLRNGVTYEFRVVATNVAGDSEPSNVATGRPMPLFPQPPSGLTATPGDGQVSLHWQPSPTPRAWYWVEYKARGSFWIRLKYPVQATSLTLKYLPNGYLYDFRVRATNISGVSEPSNVASARPMPPFPQPPTALTATAGNGQVTLRWRASPTPGVWYWVEYRARGGYWLRLKYPVPGQTSLVVQHLTNGYVYDFRVRATNISGVSDPSNVASALPMPPRPDAPTGLRSSDGPGYVSLKWHAVVPWGAGVWVYFRNRSAGQRNWSRTPAWETTSTTVYGLGTGDVYDFKVIVDYLGMESAASNVVTDTPQNARDGGTTRRMNAVNRANVMALALADARNLLCRNDLWQIVCFNFSPAGGRPMTVGDFLFYPYPEHDLIRKLRCEAFQRLAMVEKHRYSVRGARLYGPDLMRHEAVHSDQWARFPKAQLFSAAYAANPMWFEREANLFWGGYNEACPGHTCPYDGSTDDPTKRDNEKCTEVNRVAGTAICRDDGKPAK